MVTIRFVKLKLRAFLPMFLNLLSKFLKRAYLSQLICKMLSFLSRYRFKTLLVLHALYSVYSS